jgi:hypothetical protein
MNQGPPSGSGQASPGPSPPSQPEQAIACKQCTSSTNGAAGIDARRKSGSSSPSVIGSMRSIQCLGAGKPAARGAILSSIPPLLWRG